MKPLVICFILLSSFGCASSRTQSEAELRLRRYFQLPRNVDLDSNPSPLLSTLPVGTPENEIYDFLEKSGMGKDGLSSYSPANDRREIVCRVEYDVKSPGLVKEHFGIVIQLDETGRLKQTKVLKWLTGA